MIQGQTATDESINNKRTVAHQQHLAQSRIDQLLQRLSRVKVPAKGDFESYLRHKWRLNHKPRTL